MSAVSQIQIRRRTRAQLMPRLLSERSTSRRTDMDKLGHILLTGETATSAGGRCRCC